MRAICVFSSFAFLRLYLLVHSHFIYLFLFILFCAMKNDQSTSYDQKYHYTISDKMDFYQMQKTKAIQ